MPCSKCGLENRAGRKFCAHCGAKLTIVCGSCDAENEPGEQFCGECGKPFAEPTKPPTSPDPRFYTPKHLAEKILTSRSAVEGERKQVTVLFADVKGSMDLSESIDPEDWHRIMERFFKIMTDGVHRFEGTVNQYTGDGIMALFGAPIAHEDHATRACHAALALQEHLRRYANELRTQKGLTFSVRMGLNSGEVVVGRIGDDLRMDYTALGHTASLGARMEHLAEPGKCCLTEYTAKLVEGLVSLQDLGKMSVRGVKEPLRVYELQGVGPFRTRLEVSRDRGFSKFVGRDHEMAILEGVLEQALQGNGRVMGIVADPGVGKSRLCHEFVERCRERTINVYEARCVSHGRTLSFMPVLELFRDFFAITGEDTETAAREKITARAIVLEPQLEEFLPLVFDFFGVPDPSRPLPGMEPEGRQRMLFTFAKRLVHALTVREPSVFVVEDLHWIDRASEAFLANHIEILPGTRSLLVVNFRPEYHADWMRGSRYQQISLAPLDARATDALVEDLVGPDPALSPLATRIGERTRGNPFFAEEVVRSLVEKGDLVGSRGAYRLSQPVGEIAIPATVQTVLASRIDRLAEGEKAVLQAASVIGKEFSGPLLGRVSGLSEVELAGALTPLLSAELVYEKALHPEAEYTFKHPLTQEVAYRSQLSERRAETHRAVARTLSRLHPDKLDEKAALIAHHWENAGDDLEAAKWSNRAGDYVRVRDATEAVRRFLKVVDLLSRVPETAETAQLDLGARINVLFSAAMGVGGAERAAEIFTDGKELAERWGDTASLAWLTTSYSILKASFGETDQALELTAEASRLDEQTGLDLIRATTDQNSIFLCLVCGPLGDGLKLAERILQVVGRGEWVGEPSFIRLQRGELLVHMGRPLEALEDLRRATEESERCGGDRALPYTWAARVWAAEITGDPEPALDHARRGVDAAERTGNYSIALCTCLLGLAHLLRNEWDEACAAFERSLGMVRQGAGLIFECLPLAYLAEAYLGQGAFDRARATAESAVAAGRLRKTRPLECRAQIALARVLLATKGERAAIESALARAAALIEETGAISYRPFVHEARAQLASLAGDTTARHRELREAYQLFTEMAATGHAERLARQLETRGETRPVDGHENKLKQYPS